MARPSCIDTLVLGFSKTRRKKRSASSCKSIDGTHLATSLLTDVILNFFEVKLRVRRSVRADALTAERDTKDGGAEGDF